MTIRVDQLTDFNDFRKSAGFRRNEDGISFLFPENNSPSGDFASFSNKNVRVIKSEELQRAPVVIRRTTKPKNNQNLQGLPAPLQNNVQVKPINTEYQKKIMTVGERSIGWNETDGSANQVAMNGDAINNPWCASYVCDRAEKAGGNLQGLGSRRHSVPGLMAWGKETGRFQPGEKSNYQNVSTGDIVVWYDDKTAHAGIVGYVYPNGMMETYEGNTIQNGVPDIVAKKLKPINGATGFIKMS